MCCLPANGVLSTLQIALAFSLSPVRRLDSMDSIIHFPYS